MMKFLATMQRRLGFTPNEARAILLLGATFLVGLGIRWYQDASPKAAGTSFDYRASDSIYAARATLLAAPGAPARTQQRLTSTTRKPAVPPVVHLNSATKAQLILLPGVGAAYAERILTFRKERGRFRSVDELLKIKGIGQKKMEKIRPFVVLD